MRRIACVTALSVTVLSLTVSGCGSSDREAGNLGTRVCIQNQSQIAANVTFTKKDTARGEGALAQGSQACGEGTFFLGNDVEGRITLAPPVSDLTFEASNPWTGWPDARLYMQGRWCAGGGMNEGQESVWDDGVLLYSVQRIADGQWKEFVVTISPSQQPSATGQPAQCSGAPHTREHI